MYVRLPRLLTRCLTSSKSKDFPPTREDELLAVDGQSRSQLLNCRPTGNSERLLDANDELLVASPVIRWAHPRIEDGIQTCVVNKRIGLFSPLW